MTTDSPMPSPPFPSPDSAVLRLIVGNPIASVRSGEASVEEAILYAAVHGWYEGHVQGEDECPGCDVRRRAAQTRRLRLSAARFRSPQLGAGFA